MAGNVTVVHGSLGTMRAGSLWGKHPNPQSFSNRAGKATQLLFRLHGANKPQVPDPGGLKRAKLKRLRAMPGT